MQRGYSVLARRWRGSSGEIDLIVAAPDGVVVVEVKKSRSFDRAVQALSSRQAERIYGAASEFIGTLPTGQLTNVRLDVGLVNEIGEIRILENAIMF